MKLFRVFCILSVLFVNVFVVNAETVTQAMQYAYEHSPQIKLEHEKLNLSNESILSAEAGHYPTLNGELSLSENISRSYSTASGWSPVQNTLGLSASLNANYTLWDNGITNSKISQAKINKLAQQDAFILAEQSFLMNVFTSYVDVLKNSALLNVQIKNFNVISEQLKASQSRFEVGEATQTDISLAKARKSAAKSSIAGAKAQLDSSRAIYEQIIGHKPKNIRQPKSISKLLPRSLKSAIKLAEKNHPSIQSLKKTIVSSEKSVEISEAGLLPKLSAFGSLSQSISLDGSAAQSSLSVGAKLSVPIFDGGLKDSQTRQSKIRVAQARLNLSVMRAQSKANITAIWANLIAANTGVGAMEAQIRASRSTLNGVKAEALEGIKTSFDILNSEQELLAAKVQLIVSLRDVQISQMQLLSSTGGLTLKKLGLK